MQELGYGSTDINNALSVLFHKNMVRNGQNVVLNREYNTSMKSYNMAGKGSEYIQKYRGIETNAKNIRMILWEYTPKDKTMLNISGKLIFPNSIFWEKPEKIPNEHLLQNTITPFDLDLNQFEVAPTGQDNLQKESQLNKLSDIIEWKNTGNKFRLANGKFIKTNQVFPERLLDKVPDENKEQVRPVTYRSILREECFNLSKILIDFSCKQKATDEGQAIAKTLYDRDFSSEVISLCAKLLSCEINEAKEIERKYSTGEVNIGRIKEIGQLFYVIRKKQPKLLAFVN